MHSPVFASGKISDFFDEENSAVATLALHHLASHFKIDPERLGEGLSARPPCRFEKIGEVIFDVAHNSEAIFSLLQALHSFFPTRKFRFLVGFSQEKDYDKCLDLIADVATHIHLVQADSPRAAQLEALEAALIKGRSEAVHRSPLSKRVCVELTSRRKRVMSSSSLLAAFISCCQPKRLSAIASSLKA